MEDKDVLSLEILKRAEACELEIVIKHGFIYISDISTKNTLRQFHVDDLYKLYYFIDGAHSITIRNEKEDKSEQTFFKIGERVQLIDNPVYKGVVISHNEKQVRVKWDSGSINLNRDTKLCKIIHDTECNI